jgi:hypothetical protein
MCLKQLKDYESSSELLTRTSKWDNPGDPVCPQTRLSFAIGSQYRRIGAKGAC